MVLKITYGEQSFLFMGDAEGKTRTSSPNTPKYVEKKLLAGNHNLKVSLLKIAHHGSETSSTVPFIQAVDPNHVVIQSGRKCFRGRILPDITTLNRYCENSPAVLFHRTDFGEEQLTVEQALDGDHIVFRTDGVQLEMMNGNTTGFEHQRSEK